jgi:hypothetical protein
VTFGGHSGASAGTSEVVIGIRVELNQAKKAMREAQKTFYNAEKEVSKAMSGVSKSVKGAGKAAAQAKKNLELAPKELAKAQEKVRISTERLNKALGRSPFPAWALSVMFFGMALQRTFNRIWQSATRTFKDVSSSVEGSVTQFDILDGSIKYLGFVAGQALEPIAGMLVPIVNRVADWIEQNEELFRGLTLSLGVVGSITIAVGFLTTSIRGLRDAVITAGLAFSVFSKKGKAGGFLTSLKGQLGRLPRLLGVFGVALTVLSAAWKANFGGMSDFVSETFSIIWDTIKIALKGIITIVDNFMKVLIAIFESDWDTVFTTLVDTIVVAVKTILKVFIGLSSAIVNAFAFSFNTALASFTTLLNGILWGLAQIAEAFDTVFKTNVAGAVESASKALDNFNRRSRIDFITAEDVRRGMGNVDLLFDRDRESPSAETTNVYNNNTINIDARELMEGMEMTELLRSIAQNR